MTTKLNKYLHTHTLHPQAECTIHANLISCRTTDIQSFLTTYGALSHAYNNKKHLKNVGPIRHNEPPHAHSADVASGTVPRRLRIDVHDDNDNA